MEVAAFLHSFVRLVKPMIIVECGCGCGYSTLYIAQALKDNGYGKLREVRYRYTGRIPAT